jgi:UDP-N-acetylglucosamine 2-epimerase (non-hydrolysing)
MVESEKVLLKEAPDITLVQGDTNTVLCVSLVASKLHLPLGHVEAGLRSFDRRMPEEINRVVADHLADLLFAPTEVSKNNLLREGVSPNSIHVTGNTVVDAVHQNLALSEGKASILGTYGLEDNGYFLVTLHRAENVDDAYKLQGILSALRKISELHGLPVVFPVHPRTKKMIDKFGLSRGGLVAIQPLGYLEFLSLASRAKLLLTDSGGVQ